MIYNYVIVEDLEGQLKNLRMALKNHPAYQEVGNAYNLNQGKALVEKLKPHLVFLDVELGTENGFDLIKEIRQHHALLPFFIMTTDFEKYAKRAVNMDILYFLDKPIDNDELVLALNKFERKYLSAQNQISIKNTEGHFFLKLDDIVYILSDGNYCEIYRKHNRMMKVSKSLKEIETLLSAPFIRIHSNCIINAKFVEMINTTEKIVRLNLEDAKTKEKVSVRISNTYLKSVKNQLLTARKY